MIYLRRRAPTVTRVGLGGFRGRTSLRAKRGGCEALAGGSNPAAAIFADSDNGGYWVATANGNVLPFGQAPNLGGLSNIRLNGPIIAGAGF